MTQENQTLNNDEEASTIKVPKIFNSDIFKSPCFRKAFLNSLSIGFGFGIIRFMFTSNIGKSFKLALNCFTLSNVLIFFGCQVYTIKQKFKILQLEPSFRGYANVYGNNEDEEEIIKE